MFISGLFFFFFSFLSYSICPVCTLTAGATFAFARYLGISDLSTGILIYAFLFSSSELFKNWLMKKRINKYVSITSSYFIHFGSIYFIYEKYAQNTLDFIFGMNTFLFGIIVGFFSSLFSQIIYRYLKKNNNNKPFFPFQKIVMFILFNIISVIIFSFLH